MWGPVLGSILPSRRPVTVTILFKKDHAPKEEDVRRIVLENGYEIATGTITVSFRNNQMEWHFVAISKSSIKIASVASFAEVLSKIGGVESFYLARARN